MNLTLSNNVAYFNFEDRGQRVSGRIFKILSKIHMKMVDRKQHKKMSQGNEQGDGKVTKGPQNVDDYLFNIGSSHQALVDYQDTKYKR